jgi:myo-inositol-1(or 4)-monophosphatase
VNERPPGTSGLSEQFPSAEVSAVGASNAPAQPHLLALAERVAQEAGSLLLERFERGTEPALASKSTPTDLVSEADLASERLIRERLASERPDDAFLGEEGGGEQGTSGLTWVVDPLDGTVNFLFGLPQWCVSVAVRDSQGELAGAIFDPCRDELFCATRDGDALLNGQRLSAPVGRCESLAQALVATGFAYDARVRDAQAEVLARLLGRVRDIRRCGSAALDLAWTAAGRYDAYFERTVKPWDIAAGTLVCQRVGLQLRELPERPGLPWGVMVASAEIGQDLAALVG